MYLIAAEMHAAGYLKHTHVRCKMVVVFSDLFLASRSVLLLLPAFLYSKEQ